MSGYENTVIQEKVKKSDLNAKSGFDYQYLVYENPSFLKAEIRMEDEDLEITYSVGERKPMTDIREEDVTDCLLVLKSIESLGNTACSFKFSLRPENLFYNRHGVAAVKSRDIYGESEEYNAEEFLAQYKALAGFALQKKYSFDDIYRGGNDLFKQDRLLAAIGEAGSISEVGGLLVEELTRIKTNRKEKYELLPKRKYSIVRALAVVFGVGVAAAIVFLVFHFVYVESYKDAVISLGENYVNEDNSACIAEMEGVPIERMTSAQQYMLATAYVSCEAISTEQRDNILDTIRPNGTPARLAYWIYLGRWQSDKALDIAKQLSDGQLQIYAYLKARAYVEGDNSLTGAEKQEKIEEIEKELEALEKLYDITGDEEE